MRRFSEAEVVPHAQEWHLKDDYIPLELISQMSELGVSLTCLRSWRSWPRQRAMYVVSEELSARQLSAWAPCFRDRRSPRN
ncbi:MAG: acyl-CoA dehydrogenase family protein [Hyphomicrobiales bacterium]